MGIGCGHSISKLINNERAKAKYAANMELCASKMPSKKVGLAQVVIWWFLMLPGASRWRSWPTQFHLFLSPIPSNAKLGWNHFPFYEEDYISKFLKRLQIKYFSNRCRRKNIHILIGYRSVRRSVLRLLANSGETFLELVTSLSTATLKNVPNPFLRASEVENLFIPPPACALLYFKQLPRDGENSRYLCCFFVLFRLNQPPWSSNEFKRRHLCISVYCKI